MAGNLVLKHRRTYRRDGRDNSYLVMSVASQKRGTVEMKRLVVLFLMLAAGAHLSAQNSSTSATQSSGDMLFDMMIAGFNALGFDSAETAARVNLVTQRAENQVLDTMLRSALIAGGWVTGFTMYGTDTTVRISKELVANGADALYIISGDVSEMKSGTFVAVILNKPIPDTYKFAVRSRDGSTVADVLAVRRFPVFRKDIDTEATAYEVLVNTDRFDDERMYLDIYNAGH